MELYHHGIEGQKWGVRRFQNPDGSLTEEGRIRYGKDISRIVEGAKKDNEIGRTGKIDNFSSAYRKSNIYNDFYKNSGLKSDAERYKKELQVYNKIANEGQKAGVDEWRRWLNAGLDQRIAYIKGQEAAQKVYDKYAKDGYNIENYRKLVNEIKETRSKYKEKAVQFLESAAGEELLNTPMSTIVSVDVEKGKQITTTLKDMLSEVMIADLWKENIGL